MNRSLLVLISLLVMSACVDTAEPTGPGPNEPPPDDPGDLISSVSWGADLDGSAAAAAEARKKALRKP